MAYARSLSMVAVCASATPAFAGGFGIREIGVRRTGMATIIGNNIVTVSVEAQL